MSWNSFFFADALDKRAAEIEKRRMWAAIHYANLTDMEKRAGLAFTSSVGGVGDLSAVRPRTVKSGQFFLHREGKYSAIAKDKETGRLRWLDLSSTKGYLTDTMGGEDLGRLIDLDGNWMKVADDKEEFIRLQLDGKLGSNDRARAYWGAKK